MDYFDKLRAMTDNQGEILLKKDYATHKVMSKLVHDLDWEFANEFAVRN